MLPETFTFLQTLPEGATGPAFQVRRIADGRLLHLKVFATARRELLEKEVAALRRLRHPGLPEVVEIGTTPDGFPYLAQEWCAGEPFLEAWLRVLEESPPLAAFEWLLCVARETALTLEAIHRQGLVHGDMKAAHILVEKGADGQPKVTLVDFGLARPRTVLSGPAGLTPVTGAPEAAAGAPPDPRADAFAFGVTFAEAFWPYRPLFSDPVNWLRWLRSKEELPLPEGLPEWTEDIAGKEPLNEFAAFLRLTTLRSPTRRFSRMGALASALGGLFHRLKTGRPEPEAASLPWLLRPAFTGRDHLLEEIVAWVKDGEERQAVVLGGDGSGKSRFLDVLRMLAEQEGINTVLLSPSGGGPGRWWRGLPAALEQDGPACVAGEMRSRPWLLLVDDAAEMDEGSRRTLEALLAQEKAPKVMFAATDREALEGLDPGALSWELLPLESAESQTLAASMLAAPVEPERRWQELLKLGSGLPGRLVEVLHAAWDAGVLQWERDRWRVGGKPGTPFPLPATLKDLLKNRLVPLSPSALLALQLAAFNEGSLSKETAAAFPGTAGWESPPFSTSFEGGRLPEVLDSLVPQGWMARTEEPPGWTLSQGSAGPVIREHTEPKREVKLHRCLLEAIGTLPEDRHPALAAGAAGHALALKLYDQAAIWYRLAGDEARRLGSWNDSLAAYEAGRTALNSHEPFRNKWQKNRPLQELSVALALNAGSVLLVLRRLDEAEERLKQALALAWRGKLKAHEGRCLLNLGNLASYQGKGALSVKYHEEALEAFREGESRLGEAQASCGLGNLALAAQDQARAWEWYRRALEGFQAADDRPGLAVVRNNLAGIMVRRGELQEALEAYRAVASLREGLGDAAGTAVALGNQGEVYSLLGRPHEAATLKQEALSQLASLGQKRHWGRLMASLAEDLLAQGRLADAEDQLNAIDTESLTVEEAGLVSQARMRLSLFLGEYAEASAAAQAILGQEDPAELPLLTAAYRTACECARARGAELPKMPTELVRFLSVITQCFQRGNTTILSPRQCLKDLLDKGNEFAVIVDICLAEAECFLLGNNPAETLTFIQPLLLVLQECGAGMALTEASLLEQLALLGIQQDGGGEPGVDLDTITGALQRAADESGASQRRLQRWECLILLARCAGLQQHREDATLLKAMEAGLAAEIQSYLPKHLSPADWRASTWPPLRLDLAWPPKTQASVLLPPPHEAAPAHPLPLSSDRFEVLLQVTRALATAPNLDALLDKVVEQALALTGAERGVVLLFDEDEAVSTLAHRHMEEILKWEEAPLSRSVIEEVMHSGKPILLGDALSDEAFRHRRSVLAHELRTLMCAPLLPALSETGAKPFGVLYVDGTSETRAPGEEGLKLFEALAGHAAIAIENTRLRDSLAAENRLLKAEVRERYHFGLLVGKSAPMQRLYSVIEKVARSEANVLITGPSGTGKELVAKVIHYNSSRRDHPLISINCAALPESLLERELFGIEKGIATGVEAGSGLIEQAHRGTLFLDEIGDMSLTTQAKILRVLQERTLRRIGGRRDIPVDIRLISATNKDLWEETRNSRFRDDLLYRLDVVSLSLPPLRDRVEDIPLLFQHFLKKFSERNHKAIAGLTPSALERLMSYSWPGNVRELENQVERMVSLADDGAVLGVEDLSPRIFEAAEETAFHEAESLDLRGQSGAYQVRIVEAALREAGGNKTKAAKILGITREGLRKKLLKFKETGLS